jgi:mannose/fructose/N-acetylgalactosamine-specific phosphotransferase system component IIC
VPAFGLPQLVDMVPLSLLGGVLGLDVVSFPQAMISRPIVASTLGGAFAGHPLAGLVCGAALECLAVESLPVGASRYPEWGSASTVAGVLAAQGVPEAASLGTLQSRLPGAGSLAIAVVLGILTAWIGGWTMVRHRRLIAAWARPRMDQLAVGDTRTMVSLQLYGMTADLLRGTLLTFVVLAPGLWFTGWANERWTLGDDVTRAIVVTSVAAVAAAAIWKDFHAIAGTRRLFLAALAIGTAGVILRG